MSVNLRGELQKLKEMPLENMAFLAVEILSHLEIDLRDYDADSAYVISRAIEGQFDKVEKVSELDSLIEKGRKQCQRWHADAVKEWESNPFLEEDSE